MVATIPPIDLLPAMPPVRTLTAADLDGVVEELAAYHAHFAPLFRRREQRAWAAVYLRGLLTADVPRKNLEALALRLLGAGPAADRQVRALQQFVGEGGWADAGLLAAHQRLVDETLGEADGVLIIDGHETPKQGTHSAGVARQWCGHTGKKDNCQAGVYLGYASRRGYTLLDRRLYLPQEWLADAAYAARREACGVPADTPFLTKPQLGGAMIRAVREAGTLRCRWVACDEGFGRDTALLDRIAAEGLWYYAEVPHDTRVWVARPATAVPAWSGRGRPPTREQLAADAPAPQAVAELAATLPTSAWSRQLVQAGSKGPLVAAFAALRVVAVRDDLPGPAVWLLLRRQVETGELKTYLSNAPADTPLGTLVRLSGMRWPIERCLEEGKQLLGLGDYEVRSWRGWHHHLTLCILAHFFLVRLQCRWGGKGAGVDPAASPTAGGGGPAQARVRRGMGAGGAGLLATAQLCRLPRTS